MLIIPHPGRSAGGFVCNKQELNWTGITGSEPVGRVERTRHTGHGWSRFVACFAVTQVSPSLGMSSCRCLTHHWAFYFFFSFSFGPSGEAVGWCTSAGILISCKNFFWSLAYFFFAEALACKSQWQWAALSEMWENDQQYKPQQHVVYINNFSHHYFFISQHSHLSSFLVCRPTISFMTGSFTNGPCKAKHILYFS